MERGWCYVELRLSSLVKQGELLWELRKYDATHKEYANTFNNLRKMLKARIRRPPMSPTRLVTEMRERVERLELFFSYAADLEPVIELYTRGFVQAFERMHGMLGNVAARVFLPAYGWGDSEAEVAADAIAYVESHCEIALGKGPIFSFSDNYTAAGTALLEGAARGKIQVHVAR